VTSAQRFQLLFRGEVLEGFTPDQVQKGLIEKFRKPPEQIARLFAGGTHFLARNLSGDAASRLSESLRAQGAVVYVQEMEAPGAVQPAPARPAPPVPERAAAQPAPASAPVAPAQAPAVSAPQERTPTTAPVRPRAAARIVASALGEVASPSRAARARYRFDTFMAKGGASVFVALVLAFVGVLTSVGLARGAYHWLTAAAPPESGELDALGNLFLTFLQLTDPGNMSEDLLASPIYKAFGVAAGLSGVILLSALVAFITTALDQKLNDLKRGRSKVIESGHTLILGWNEQRIVEILRELILANESEKDACVVILADRDKEEMDDALRLRLPDTKTTRLVTRSGSVSTLANLDMVSLETARSVIVLSLCEDTAGPADKAASDAMIIQIILAATGKAPADQDLTIVAEIYDPMHREIVEASFGDRVVTVNTSEILAKLLVQTSRSVGLSMVYNELLSFDGSEMYFHAADWGDVRFADLAYRFPDGVPMGVRTRRGEIALNPPGERAMQPGDEVLILAEDDSSIDFVAKAVAKPKDLALPARRLERQVERELVIGWNHKAPTILREFADYVTAGSQVHILLKDAPADVRAEIEALGAELDTLEVRLLDADCLNREQLVARQPFTYDNIILLAGDVAGAADAGQIDSRNIVTLLLLRNIAGEHAEPGRSTKVITELIDSQNHPLVARAGVKDVVISNRLVSMLIAQISQSRSIKRVYDDIFQEDGSEIYLKPASLYFDQFPAALTFADLIGIARKRNEVCIGFKAKALEREETGKSGVALNPKKDARVSLQRDDCLIVLAEDEL
jgi:hypothetical protein